MGWHQPNAVSGSLSAVDAASQDVAVWNETEVKANPSSLLRDLADYGARDNDIFVQRVISDSAISAAAVGGTGADKGYMMFIAPFPCRVVSAAVGYYSSSPTNIGPSALNNWQFKLRKNRGTAAQPVPANSGDGSNAGDICAKSNSTDGIFARVPFRLGQGGMDAQNRVLRTGDYLSLHLVVLTGTPTDLPDLYAYVRLERI